MDFCPVRNRYFPKGKVPPLPHDFTPAATLGSGLNPAALLDSRVDARESCIADLIDLEVCDLSMNDSGWCITTPSASVCVTGTSLTWGPGAYCCSSSSLGHFTLCGDKLLHSSPGSRRFESATLSTDTLSHMVATNEGVFVSSEGYSLSNLTPIPGGFTTSWAGHVSQRLTCLQTTKTDPSIALVGTRSKAVLLFDTRAAGVPQMNVPSVAPTALSGLDFLERGAVWTHSVFTRAACGALSVLDLRFAPEARKALKVSLRCRGPHACVSFSQTDALLGGNPRARVAATMRDGEPIAFVLGQGRAFCWRPFSNWGALPPAEANRLFPLRQGLDAPFNLLDRSGPACCEPLRAPCELSNEALLARSGGNVACVGFHLRGSARLCRLAGSPNALAPLTIRVRDI